VDDEFKSKDFKRVVWQLCTASAKFNNTMADDARSVAEARRRTGLVGTGAPVRKSRANAKKNQLTLRFSRGFTLVWEITGGRLSKNRASIA
jgi:hypothetical protein